MNLTDKVGEYVVSETFGTGVITEIKETCIVVMFDGETITRRFAVTAFKQNFLKFVDQALQSEIDEEIKQVEKDAAKKADEQRRAEEEEREAIKRKEILEKREKNPNENMVFRSQICDGGTQDFSNWFKGPCTDNLRDYHVNRDRHSTWCKCSVCKKMVDGCAGYEDINQAYDNGTLCYESKILLNHEVKAGWDTDRHGALTRPRSWKLKDDHLVILMTVEPGAEQEDAFIYSAFLSSNTTQAGYKTEGSTRAAQGCFIDLTVDEARQMKLWEYMPAVGGENPTFWGNGLFRYVSDDVSSRVLADMVEIVKKRGVAEDTKNAESFLKKYLDSFGGKVGNIPPKSGALAT